MSAPSKQQAGLASAKGQRFWRGLDELIDEPVFRAKLARRFPALAAYAGDWRRRDILKCLGGTIALAGLDGCERAADEEALPFVDAPEGQIPGIARYYATSFEYEGIAQPLVGKTREGRPIKLEGNPQHPASRGATDAITQAALLGLYDPDRSGAPLKLGAPLDWARFDTELAALRRRLDANGGAGFRLLTGPSRSPTLLRQIGALLERWPVARWHAWSPVSDPAGAGLEGSSERRLLLDEAHVIVAFDADPLGPGPRQTWHATRWGQRRRAYQRGDGAALLLVAEPTPTLTGVTAGQRLVARTDRVEQLMRALAASLGMAEGGAPRLTAGEDAWIGKAASELKARRGQGLVLVGDVYPPSVRALAQRIDDALRNLGRTSQPVPQRNELQAASLGALADDMAAGEVESLFVLEANPLYSAPPRLDFPRLFARVPQRIHAGLHVDETGAASHWHVPLAHGLESWSDGEAADGSALLAQPLVRPWMVVRSRHELLSGLLGDTTADRELVRATWQLDSQQWAAALIQG